MLLKPLQKENLGNLLRHDMNENETLVKHEY